MLLLRDDCVLVELGSAWIHMRQGHASAGSRLCRGHLSADPPDSRRIICGKISAEHSTASHPRFSRKFDILPRWLGTGTSVSAPLGNKHPSTQMCGTARSLPPGFCHLLPCACGDAYSHESGRSSKNRKVGTSYSRERKGCIPALHKTNQIQLSKRRKSITRRHYRRRRTARKPNSC